jgi:hypothetical protein
MDELAKKVEPAMNDLLESDEDQLYEQLGIRSSAMTRDLSVAGALQPQIAHDVAAMGMMEDVRDLGKRIFKRWNREAHKLICGGEDLDKKDREALANAFGLGDAAVAGVVASLLITQFGLAPAIATVVAALVIKRFFRPAYDEFCDFWKEKLPAAS